MSVQPLAASFDNSLTTLWGSINDPIVVSISGRRTRSPECTVPVEPAHTPLSVATEQASSISPHTMSWLSGHNRGTNLRAQARAQLRDGQESQAMDTYQQLLTWQRRTLGNDHLETLATLHEFAQEHPDADTTIAMLREAYEARRRVLGEADPDTLASMQLLGEALQLRGGGSRAGSLDSAESVALLDRAVGLWRCVAPADLAATAQALATLGWALHRSQRCADSLVAYTESVDLSLQRFGVQHHHTLWRMGQLATVCEDLGDWTRAVQIWEQVYQAHHQAGGPDQRSTRCARQRLARALHRQGSPHRAVDMYRDNYDRARLLDGPDDASTIDAARHLALALCDIGEFTEAVALLEDVVVRLERRYGSGHASVASAHITLDAARSRHHHDC